MIYFQAGLLQKLIAKGNWERFRKEFTKEWERFQVLRIQQLKQELGKPAPNVGIVRNIEFQDALFGVFAGISSGAVGDSRPSTLTNDGTPSAIVLFSEGVEKLQHFATADFDEHDVNDSYRRSRSFEALETAHKHRVMLSITPSESANWQQQWRSLAVDLAPVLGWMN